MKTATRIVRVTGPKSLLESIETRAATDIKAVRDHVTETEASLRTTLSVLDAGVVSKVEAVKAEIVDHGTKLASMAEHEIRIAALEAREIDRASVSVLRRVWRWFTTYEGLL